MVKLTGQKYKQCNGQTNMPKIQTMQWSNEQAKNTNIAMVKLTGKKYNNGRQNTTLKTNDF